ncbi:EpsG family protein [Acinetobacter sp. ANC 5383]
MLIDNDSFELLYNLIYFCTGCFVIVSAISSEFKKDILLQNKLAHYVILLPLIALIIITGFREYNVGTDTMNYYNLLWLDNSEFTFNGEFMFSLIAFVLHVFELDYTFFIFLIALIFYLFIYKALKNYIELYKANLLISFFAYLSLPSFLSMSINVIRQGVSLAILLYAYSLFLRKNDLFKVILFTFLALIFHLTSIIPILIFLIAYFIPCNKNKAFNFLLLIYFIALISAYLNYGFLNISPALVDLLGNDRRAGYLSGDSSEYKVGFKFQFVVFNTFFLFLSLYVRRKLKNDDIKHNYNILISYYIISSIVLFLAFQLPFSDRWGLFSWILIPFLIAPLFYSPLLKGGIRIHFVLMLILIFIGFKFYAG